MGKLRLKSGMDFQYFLRSAYSFLRFKGSFCVFLCVFFAFSRGRYFSRVVTFETLRYWLRIQVLASARMLTDKGK